MKKYGTNILDNTFDVIANKKTNGFFCIIPLMSIDFMITLLVK